VPAGTPTQSLEVAVLFSTESTKLRSAEPRREGLNPDRNTIERAEVLEAYNPIFDAPTTGTLVGDFLYFAASPQIDKRREDGSMPPPNQLQDIHIVKLKL
jgi:hypothetical protein